MGEVYVVLCDGVVKYAGTSREDAGKSEAWHYVNVNAKIVVQKWVNGEHIANIYVL